MPSFYQGMATVASSLLAKYGQSVTFTRDVVSAFNPTTGVETSTTTTFTGNAASFDYVSNEIDGEVVQMGDIRLLVEAVSTTPVSGDKCTVDSVDYRVMSVRESSPGGIVTHYEVQLRR